MIKVDQIIPLLKALNYPLSLQKNFKQEQKLRYLIAKLVLPLYTKNGEKVKGLWDVPVKRPTIRMVVELTTKQELYYNFHDVLLALAHNSLVSNDSREYKE